MDIRDVQAMDEEVSPRQIGLLLKQHRALVIACILACVALGLVLPRILDQQFTYTTRIEAGRYGSIDARVNHVLERLRYEYIPAATQAIFNREGGAHALSPIGLVRERNSAIITMRSVGPSEEQATQQGLHKSVAEMLLAADASVIAPQQRALRTGLAAIESELAPLAAPGTINRLRALADETWDDWQQRLQALPAICFRRLSGGEIHEAGDDIRTPPQDGELSANVMAVLQLVDSELGRGSPRVSDVFANPLGTARQAPGFDSLDAGELETLYRQLHLRWGLRLKDWSPAEVLDNEMRIEPVAAPDPARTTMLGSLVGLMIGLPLALLAHRRRMSQHRGDSR